MANPKPCPQCGSADIEVDSAQGGSWAQCRECEFKVQHPCSEEAIVKRWNALKAVTEATCPSS